MSRVGIFFMSLLCPLFIFASILTTDIRTLYHPNLDSQFSSISRQKIVSHGDQLALVVDVSLVERSYKDPDRYWRDVVYLDFHDTFYDKDTKEVFYKDKKIGKEVQSCWWIFCNDKIELDFKNKISL